MIKKLAVLVFLLSVSVSLSGCKDKAASIEKKEMIFYIGITMVKPVTQLAENFMKIHGCSIKIIQGGSKDLYESALSSSAGDLYLPGSVSYRRNNLKDGILLDGKFVGYNRAAIMVARGNPKKVTSDLSTFSDKKYRVVLCNPESGSIGKETKKILKKFGNYREAMENAAFLTTDSRNLTKSIKDNTADVCINWHATSTWDTNKDYVETIAIDSEYTTKKKLVFNLLKSSKHTELARKFMDYAASEEGRNIFHHYGFLSDEDLRNFNSITF